MEPENSILRNEGLETESNVLPMAKAVDSKIAEDLKKGGAGAGPDCDVTAKKSFPAKHHDRKSATLGLNKVLNDAEYLLDYACQAGIELDQEMVHTIICAGAEDDLCSEDAVKAIAAVTTLAQKLKPVTAETLRACRDRAGQTIHKYWTTAATLGIFLLLSSVLSFIASGLSKSLTDDINLANQLAVTLNSDVAPQPLAAPGADGAAPPAVAVSPATYAKNLANLQQFAATIREVDGLSHQLGYFVLASEPSRPTEEAMEIAVPVNHASVNIPMEVEAKTRILQRVRYFAKDVQERTSLWYGALSNFLLPPLYAILGACAYLIRSFSEQVKARTFTPSVTDSARFIIAAIGGGAVGLFSNFTIGQTTSLPPLAIAFLVGYATDIFFSFLDGLQPAFTKAKAP